MKINNKLIIFTLISLFIVSFLFTCTGETETGPKEEPKSFELTVLHTNDTHGHPVAFFQYPAPGVGGMPARMTLIDKIRSEEDNVLVLDAGDVITGRPESNFFDAEPDFKGLNYMGYDALAVGNHEFDKSFEQLMYNLIPTFGNPVLNANVVYKEDESLVFEPYTYIEMNGFTVGILSLVTPDVLETTLPAHVAQFDVRNPIEVAKEIVPEMKGKADFIIALTHLGYYEDYSEAVQQNMIGDEDLAREVDGIDLIIGGHSHTFFDAPVKINNTWINHAQEWGLYLGRVDITVTEGKITELTGANIPINIKGKVKEGEEHEFVTEDGKYYFEYSDYYKVDYPIEEDEELAGMLYPYLEEVEKKLSEVIGTSKGIFPFDKKASRSDDYPIANMVCDGMREQTGVDIVLQNAGGVRTGLDEGDITKKEVYEILPFDNTVVIIDVKGSVVMDAIKHGAEKGPGSGAFLQTSGLTWTLTEQADGSYVPSDVTFIDGTPLDMDATYTIATNSFMKTGGDGYDMLVEENDNYYDSSLFQRDMIIQYVENKGTIDPAEYDDDRIKFANR